PPLPLHPFPTRRSSDLRPERALHAAAVAVDDVRVLGRHAHPHVAEDLERAAVLAAADVLDAEELDAEVGAGALALALVVLGGEGDRKSTRLNSSHVKIS